MIWLRRQYLELILFKAYAGLRAESSRNYLSFAWWVLDPILSMGTYYLVFNVLFTANHKDYVPFLLIGLVAWQWFANSINHCVGSILQGGSLMNQMRLPSAIFPSTVLVMDSVKFSLVFTLLSVFLLAYGYNITIAWLVLPLILAVQLLFIAGCAFLVAAITPLFPDLRFLVEALLQLLLFLSGVFYSGEIIPAQFREYFYLNPMVVLIDSYRQVFMHGLIPNWSGMLYVLILAISLFVASNAVLARLEQTYPKIVG